MRCQYPHFISRCGSRIGLSLVILALALSPVFAEQVALFPGNKKGTAEAFQRDRTIERLKAEKEKLAEDLSSAESRLDELEDENEQLRQDLEKLLEADKQLKGQPESKNPRMQLLQLTAELQQAWNERESLRQQMMMLEKQIDDQKKQIDRLLQQTVAEKEIIRSIDPALSAQDLSDVQMNRNLRMALLHVSGKLKTAEVRLAELETELAQLKGKTELPSGVQKSSVEQPKEIDGKLIYTPPVKNASARSMPVEPVRKLNIGESSIQIQKLQADLREHPDRVDTYFKLKEQYFAVGDYTAAEEVISALLRARPGYAPAYYELTRIYIKQKEPVKALATFTTYRRLRPKDPTVKDLERELELLTDKGNSP